MAHLGNLCIRHYWNSPYFLGLQKRQQQQFESFLIQHTVLVFHGFSKWFPAVPKSQNSQEPTLDPFHAREPATLASDAGGFPLGAPSGRSISKNEAPAKHTKERGSEWTWKLTTSKRKASAKDHGMMISSVGSPKYPTSF